MKERLNIQLMSAVSVSELKSSALRLLADKVEGAPLDALAAALIELGVRVAVTSLNCDAMRSGIERAIGAGATPSQIQEVISLVSGLGVHSLMASARMLLDSAVSHGFVKDKAPLTPDRQELWDFHIGDDNYWKSFEEELPGFLDALLRISPEIFSAFFAYCSIPWKTATVSPLIKELIAMAVDATPTQRFGPGFRLHLRNALKLGAGRISILQALDIAAAAPPHVGID